MDTKKIRLFIVENTIVQVLYERYRDINSQAEALMELCFI